MMNVVRNWNFPVLQKRGYLLIVYNSYFIVAFHQNFVNIPHTKPRRHWRLFWARFVHDPPFMFICQYISALDQVKYFIMFS